MQRTLAFSAVGLAAAQPDFTQPEVIVQQFNSMFENFKGKIESMDQDKIQGQINQALKEAVTKLPPQLRDTPQFKDIQDQVLAAVKEFNVGQVQSEVMESLNKFKTPTVDEVRGMKNELMQNQDVKPIVQFLEENKACISGAQDAKASCRKNMSSKIEATLKEAAVNAWKEISPAEFKEALCNFNVGFKSCKKSNFDENSKEALKNEVIAKVETVIGQPIDQANPATIMKSLLLNPKVKELIESYQKTSEKTRKTLMNIKFWDVSAEELANKLQSVYTEATVQDDKNLLKKFLDFAKANLCNNDNEDEICQLVNFEFTNAVKEDLIAILKEANYEQLRTQIRGFFAQAATKNMLSQHKTQRVVNRVIA